MSNIKVFEYDSVSTNQYDQLSRVFEYQGHMGFLEQSNQFAIERLVCKPSIKTHMMNMVKRLVTRQD